MVRTATFALVAIHVWAQSPDVMEGRKRAQQLIARTYVKCGENEFRLVHDQLGPNGTQQFRIAEYRGHSRLLNIVDAAPENARGLQYRAILEKSCAQKRIYTLLQTKSVWSGKWSNWVPCGKVDPDNPFVLTAAKSGQPTEIIKRAGAWSLNGATYDTAPISMSCEDVPPNSGDWNSWLRDFLGRRAAKVQGR